MGKIVTFVIDMLAVGVQNYQKLPTFYFVYWSMHNYIV